MRTRRLPLSPMGSLSLLVLLAGLLAAACAEAAYQRLNLGEAPPISVAFIVHGAEGDPFWGDVQAGAADAARAFDVNLFWRSTPDEDERVRLISEVVQQGFDVLAVTLSDPEALVEVVSEAVVIGLTVYVVNAGADAGVLVGADSYFGQDETVAGLAVGDRLVEAGAAHLLCVQHEEQNVALETRCSRAGSRLESVTTLKVDLDRGDVESVIRDALVADPTIDSVLTMTTSVMHEASSAIELARQRSPGGREVLHAVFEQNSEVLDAIEDGRVAFAVDQQPYLQGYLPVAYARLVQYSQLTQGDELADALLQWIAGRGILLGPGFVDLHNLERVREATARSAASPLASGSSASESSSAGATE